jgi:integrase
VRKGKLTIKKIERAKPGRHGDGHGLYLEVGENSASWLLRWERDGRERWHGLGSAADLTLDEAREEAREKRKLIKAGIDPIDKKRADRAAERVAKAKVRTFSECAIAYFEAQLPAWKHPAHALQWSSTVLGRTLTGQPVANDYCKPLRSLPVQAIDVPMVLSVLQPVWYEKAETARRLRNRIESVLDWATAAGLRSGDNPAALKMIGKLLPSRIKGAKEHHAALDYRELPAFITALRARQGNDARALEFAILACARTAEVLGAKWSEIDFKDKLWIVPADRMKAGKEHRQPLSPAAINLLRKLPREADNPHVFIGSRPGMPLGDSTLQHMLKKLGCTATPHGMRATFRTWAQERTNFPDIVQEMALAHSVGSETVKAYRRGELMDKRRKLLDAWATYCASPATATGEVVPLRA